MAAKAPGYEIRVQTVLKHDDGKTLWYHPRAAAIPGHGKGGKPAVVMTVQQHLHTSDHYSGMSVLRSDDWGKSWQGPTPQPERHRSKRRCRRKPCRSSTRQSCT